MTPTPGSPAWVSILSALLTPAIAIAVAYIAWQQWRTARNRLRLDLFDRRFAVYQQTRDFLVRRMALGQLETSEITDFTIKIRVSKWLFNSAIADYLENQIAKKAMDLSALNKELESITDDERTHNVSRQRELKNWLDEQLYKVIDGTFAEFLHLKH